MSDILHIYCQLLGNQTEEDMEMTLSTHNEKKITLTAHLKYNIKCQVLFYIWVDLLVILEWQAVILYFYIICWCGFNIIIAACENSDFFAIHNVI